MGIECVRCIECSMRFMVFVPGLSQGAVQRSCNSMLQRGKRMVFKVPHYKSGETIAKEVAAAKAK